MMTQLRNRVVWSFLTALLAILLAASLACGSQLSQDAPSDSQTTSTRLESIVPPCEPFPGSNVDPCERRSKWESNNPFIEVSYKFPDIIPTFKEMLLERAEWPFWATQFVVRATVIPSSTRCAWVEDNRDHADEYREGYVRKTGDGYAYCYYDLAVNEYLYGNGPARLTVNFGTKVHNGKPSDCNTKCLEQYTQLIKDDADYEGIEWIVYLGGPRDLGSSVWRTFGFDDVQRREDGEIVVVSYTKQYVPPRIRDNNLDRLEWTLADFRNVVTDAYEAFISLTGGRTGNVADRLGRPAPFLSNDAGRDGFKDFIVRTKMLDGTDVTPSPPPPIPGEGDPNPSGLTTNDIIATRVAGGVKIPGGLTDFDNPTPTLGDEPTATATTEPTATATTVTEIADTPTPEPTATAEPLPTVTPEPAPTPELIVEPTATSTPEPAPTPEPADTPTPESDDSQAQGPGDAVDTTATPEDAVRPGTTAEDATETPESDQPLGPGADDDS